MKPFAHLKKNSYLIKFSGARKQIFRIPLFISTFGKSQDRYLIFASNDGAFRFLYIGRWIQVFCNDTRDVVIKHSWQRYAIVAGNKHIQ